MVFVKVLAVLGASARNLRHLQDASNVLDRCTYRWSDVEQKLQNMYLEAKQNNGVSDSDIQWIRDATTQCPGLLYRTYAIVPGPFGIPLLHILASWNNTDIVDYVLNTKNCSDLHTHHENLHVAPLEYAIRSWNPKMMQKLLEYDSTFTKDYLEYLIIALRVWHIRDASRYHVATNKSWYETHSTESEMLEDMVVCADINQTDMERLVNQSNSFMEHELIDYSPTSNSAYECYFERCATCGGGLCQEPRLFAPSFGPECVSGCRCFYQLGDNCEVDVFDAINKAKRGNLTGRGNSLVCNRRYMNKPNCTYAD